MIQAFLICLLTFVAAGAGTISGFGTSTIMMPVLALYYPLPTALFFVAVIHLCGDIWKVILFRTGFERRIILWFGVAGVAASFVGSSFAVQSATLPLKKMLGGFLLCYVVFLVLNRSWRLPARPTTALAGGVLSGLMAGLFGVGGAVRGAFLAAFNLPKQTYVFTSGLIAFFIDITRVGRYTWDGAYHSLTMGWTLLLCIPISFAGAYWARKIVHMIPQHAFRTLIACFLAGTGLLLMLGT